MPKVFDISERLVLSISPRMPLSPEMKRFLTLLAKGINLKTLTEAIEAEGLEFTVEDLTTLTDGSYADELHKHQINFSGHFFMG